MIGGQILGVQMSGRCRRLLQTLFDGRSGTSSTELLCWGCLYGVWKSLWNGTPLSCSLFLLCRLSSTVICSFYVRGSSQDLSRLEKSLRLLDEPTLPDTLDKDTYAMLRVLQVEREKMVAEEDCDKMDGVVALAPDQDENMVDETSQSQSPEVRNALKILVRNATEEFGFAPRDVYNGVFHLQETREDHHEGIAKLTYSDLVTYVESFSEDVRFDKFWHKVIAVHPRQGPDRMDRWEVRLKSTSCGSEGCQL